MTNSNKMHVVFCLILIQLLYRYVHYGRTYLSRLWEITANDTMSLSYIETAFIAFMSTFIGLSFFSNVCIVAVVVKIKMLRTVTNLFLTNLAVSDLIFVSLILPLKVNDISHTEVSVECKLPIECPMFLFTVKKPPKQKPKGNIPNSYGVKRFRIETGINY